MERPSPVPSSAKVSLIYGIGCGLIVGIIDSIYVAVISSTNSPFVQGLYQALEPIHSTLISGIIGSFTLSIPIYLLLVIAFALASIFAARKTKKVSTGVLAGLWTGIVFVIIDLVVATIGVTYLIIFPQIVHSMAGASTAEIQSVENSSLSFSIPYSIIAGLLLIAIGIGISALGGLLGKSIGTPAQPSQAAPFNPYQPYQAYPYATRDQPPYGQPQPGQMPHQPPYGQPQPGPMPPASSNPYKPQS